MKKILTGLAIAALIGVIVVAVAWPYVKMEFASSAHYTEQDKREYEFYTPGLLKNMPRISTQYAFDFANVSGPEAHVFTLTFYNVTETKAIRDYLTSLGYELQKPCDVEANCWRNPTTTDVVTVANLLSEKGTFVQIYRSPYNEPLIEAK
ncbi:MAG: hypothetical protein E6095_04035 [Pseudescherichia vulneris]|nr:hypothetical protein [Pseudescherichia vulneris]